MALTPEQIAEIQRLKALMQQPAADAQRKAQATWNAEQIANRQGKKNGGLEKFLGPSKVKERLYHATSKDIKKFKTNQKKSSGHAVWLATDPEFQPAAHNISYRDEQGRMHPISGSNAKFREGTNVMPVHVQATNPMMLDDKDMLEWAQAAYAGGSREFPYLMPKEWADKVKEDYDSIILADPHKRGEAHEVIMFHPNKIKSAIGNRGTYDTTKTDINKAKGGQISQDAMQLALMNFLKPSKEKRRMYHGTRQQGTRSVSKPGQEGIKEFINGIRGMTFVSPESEFANSYAGRPDEEGHFSPTVYPVHVQVENPFDYENPKHVENVLPLLPYGTDYKWSVVHGKKPEHMREALKSGMWELLEDKDVVDAIKRAGHDAMYMKEGNVKNLGVFDTRKIKSAIGNRGTYDTKERDITKSNGGSVTHAHHLEIEERPL